MTIWLWRVRWRSLRLADDIVWGETVGFLQGEGGLSV